MSRAVVLANGVPPLPATLHRVLDGAACFVCADGGANFARAEGVTPRAIIGDLDSVDAATLAHFAGVEQVRDTDPERPDGEKAVAWLLRNGAWDEIVLLGASAGRLDHVLGHLSLLRRYAGRVPLVLEDDRSRSWAATGTVELDVPVGTTVSFFALGGPAEGVTTEGLLYPLRDRRLELGAQDSISNETTARPARIRIGSGDLVVSVITRP